MKTIDIIDIMNKLGWKNPPVDGGVVLQMDFGDRYLMSFARFSVTSTYCIYYDHAKVGFPFHNQVVLEIEPKLDGSWLVQRDNGNGIFKGDSATFEFFRHCTDELVAWAMTIEPWKELERMVSPASAYSFTPYAHIEALALLKQIKTLQNYLELMEAGSQPELLHPLIKKEHVERALVIARRIERAAATR
jgi:hypothetical protein